MASQIRIVLFIFLLFGRSKYCFSAVNENGSANSVGGSKKVVRVGVILDSDSGVGRMTRSYISMAISDFYATYPYYQTRISLSEKNSEKDAVVAASAALDLMKNDGVQAIIGPMWSTEAKFVISLGNKAQIPIISISASSPSFSPSQNPFFIRTCRDDKSQIKPLVSIVQQFGWRQVIVIYEDTEFGNGFIPYLTDSLQQIETRVVYRSVISASSKRQSIWKELEKIKAMETRAILVHMTASFGSELFPIAEEAGMMSKGYVWIITDGLSTLLDPIEKNVSDSIHGVLGLRPYVPNTKHLEEFKTRFNVSEINIYGLWAYDTIWALAKSVELVFSHLNSTKTGVGGLRVSELGPQLLEKLLSTRFEGLSGEFRLIRGQLQVEKFEIINVRRTKGEEVIGYWTEKKEIYIDSGGNGKVANSSSIDELKERIIWPGYYHAKVPPPKGWAIPVSGNKLRIGVPFLADYFKGFVDIKWDPKTLKVTNITGFSYDVFVAALQKLPFDVPHEFFAYVNNSGQMNGTYNDLLYQIKLGNYDAVVGDTTIIANRTAYVDFTLPYSESGVWMVVKVKDEKTKSIWIFLRPLKWTLWLTIAVAFLSTGFIVWILERRTNIDLRGPTHQQLSEVFLFSFLTPVFAHGERVENHWSRFVLTIWVFVAFIVIQSYTASLASILTVQRMQPSFVNVNELRMKDCYVGYTVNSYVRELLTGQLNFKKSRLRPYASHEEFHRALSKGSKNGGVDAMFEEIPYAKLFLSKYCSRYTTVGTTYKSDGFGFAFPLGSPLVPYMSRAILNVTEDHKKMEELELKYFSYQSKCQVYSSTSPANSHGLSAVSFGGLFIMMGLTLLFFCLIFLVKSGCVRTCLRAML
ncbi:glutamate receptor 2.8-like isoform X1 [Ziziphus jujuba]|uniref:Glutamate receptor n=1 Tax=Ziziphus jujuba TaxID=326968 RepID=A0A6P6G927_ZIZJJ|nr:glutamate receptor 2.8-like isoform X1 [Ziziphus jujuba]